MPALILFNRRSLRASDDVTPSLLTTLARGFQFWMLLLPLWIHTFLEAAFYISLFHDEESNQEASNNNNTLTRITFYHYIFGSDYLYPESYKYAHYFPLFMTSYLFLNTLHVLISLIVEHKVYQYAKIGTPTQPELRDTRVRRIVERKWIGLSLVGNYLLFTICIFGIAAFGKLYYRSRATILTTSGNNPRSSTTRFDFHNIFDVNNNAWWIPLILLLLSQITEAIIWSLGLVRLLYKKPSIPSIGNTAYPCTRRLLQLSNTNCDFEEDTINIHYDTELNNGENSYRHNHDLTEKMWDERCRSFCKCAAISTCFLFGGKDFFDDRFGGDYGDIARNLADYFEDGGVLDLAPSDIAVGFAMLQRVQRLRMLNCQNSHDPQKVLSCSNTNEGRIIAEGARFARHSLAIYTWVLYVYMYPCTGFFRLLLDYLSDSCGRKNGNDSQKRNDDFESVPLHSNENFNVAGDNFAQMNRNSLLAHVGLDNQDLIYANFKNRYNEMPYCIIVDHKWNSVVLSIRGTLSLEDCITDVVLDPDSLEELGQEHGFDGKGQHCHSGVLGCAKYIYSDLQRHLILERLLLGPCARYPHYNLRITGHSLGAGCAVLIGLIFRKQFPNLHVFSYSPPGGFLSWKLAIDCKAFVTSFVLDSDLVPRLSLENMEKLRDQTLDLIGRIKVNKVEVARNLFVGREFCNKEEFLDLDFLSHNNSQMLYPEHLTPTDSDFAIQMQKFKIIQNNRKRNRGESRDIPLYPPGQIIHLVKSGERSSCIEKFTKCVTCCTSNVGFDYTPMWAENNDFNEIIISPRMGTDHFPNRICLELERIAASFGINVSNGL